MVVGSFVGMKWAKQASIWQFQDRRRLVAGIEVKGVFVVAEVREVGPL